MSAKTKRDLAAMWDRVDYLFVDEVFMIGCGMLHNISLALTEAKGNTKVFGGINVILAGDFAQLPPIGDCRLYKDINTSLLAAGATNRAQGKVLGQLSFETVMILQETMRQSGDENARFMELLNRLQDGVCNKDDNNMLAEQRLRFNDDTNKENGWEFAPVIVSNNTMRDAIHHAAAEVFACHLGSKLQWYHSIDTHQRSLIEDPALIQKLEEQHSGQTKHRLHKIPLVIRMPIAINQNFDVAAGVVNGSVMKWRFSCSFCFIL